MTMAAIVVVGHGLAGCASLEGDDYATYDPWEGFNRNSYEVSDAVDRAVLVPVAQGYKSVTPDWVESGIGNMFLNLRTVTSSANGFLQGKPKSGFTDLGRIVVNSTIGLAGFFDVASQWGWRYQNEDLGQTLAVWGMTKSRYVYIPFMGPTTLRDLPSNIINSYVPRLILGNDYHWAISAVDVVNTRAQLLSASRVRDASAIDPYAFTKDAYFQRRKFLIYDGDPPIEDFFDDFGDDDWEDEDF